MKEGAANITDALLPPEDGAVPRALSDLKAKLSTWSAAVANVQGALAAQAAELAEKDPANATQEEATHRESGDVSDERQAAAAKEEPTVASLDAQKDGYQPQANAAEVSLTQASDDGPTAPALSLSESVEGSEETVRDSAGEDQGLLESLDEKMAEAIRVQFRLFDGRKSIRELIDSYVEEPEEPQKSWWQRMKG